MFLFNSPHLEDLVVDNCWEMIPASFISREGRKGIVDPHEGKMYLPIEGKRGVINLRRIACPILNWVVIKFVIRQACVVSSDAGFNAWNDIVRMLSHREFLSKSKSCDYPDFLEVSLVSQVEWVIAHYKGKGELWNVYRFTQFYIWAAEHYPELGFNVAYAYELEEMVIPGNPKGEAVRREFSDGGALDTNLETPLIKNALENDTGVEFEHYQQRAAVALCLSYGRNPANSAALNEEDLFLVLGTEPLQLWNLNIPRIKKRFISHRSDFIAESVELSTRVHIQNLIEKNQRMDSRVEVNGQLIEVERPLFRRTEPNGVYLRMGMYDSAYRLYASEFSRLLSAFAERMDLRSPLTGEIMHLTARRFRYTVGCVYAAEGRSRKEVAVRLDHSDLQSVEVYFTLQGKMRSALDKAAAVHFASKVNAFLGCAPVEQDLIASDRKIPFGFEDTGAVEATGGCGLDAHCERDPPLSCYLCPKFVPFRSSVHERVLDQLLSKQKAIRSPNGMGIGLADVILAVSQVVAMCRGEVGDGPHLSA